MKAKKTSRQHSWIARLLALFVVTGRVYWQTILTELEQVRRSVLMCAILLFFCGFLALAAWLSLCGLLGYEIYINTLNAYAALGGILGVNLFFMLIIGICLRSRLRQLTLPKTRESLTRIRDTVASN